MIIKSVHLKNIRSYIDEDIEFPEGSTLLSGDIGSGKSTILLSIDFALFGLRKGELSGNDLLRHGANTGSVRLHMEVDEKDVLIGRTLKRSKDTIVHDMCYITIDNDHYDLTPIELKAKILNLLGYSQELLRKNRPLFRFTVYTPQEQMKQILLHEGDRLEILRNIFGIDRYGRIRSNSRLFLTELRSMKREFEAMTKNMDDDKKLLEQIKETGISVSASLNEERNSLSGINEKFAAKKSQIDRMKDEFNELNIARHELTKKETETKSKTARLEKIRNDITNMQSKIEKSANELDSIKEMRTLNELRDEIKGCEKSRDASVSEKAIKESEIRNLRKVYENGVCALCGQTVHDPDTFRQHIDEKTARINGIESELDALDATLQSLKTAVTNAERMSHIRSSHNELLVWKNELAMEKASLEKDIVFLNNAVENLKAKTRNYDEVYVRINRLEEELQIIQKERMSAEKTVSKYEQQAEDIGKRILDLTETIKEKEKIVERASHINEIINWFGPFMLLSENIEKHVMIAIQKEFDEYFQKWFEILMGDTMSVKIDERFAPVIEQNSYETEYENLSGGEKTSVALAYRLALNRVVNDMIDNIRTKNILILDEPTDGFSTDQLDRIRDIINELNMKQIIIVSHEPKIDTYVDNVIKIYKEGHVSKVVY